MGGHGNFTTGTVLRGKLGSRGIAKFTIATAIVFYLPLGT